ncbi:MAG: SRPBCC family protein [Chloroflexi bacterium]|nr:SRPBCC family protein [Chloroflexota bacterium]
MAKLETSITINSPIEQVFAFAADLANNAKWQTGVIAAEVTSPGPVGVGTKYKYDAEIMGRKLETTGELTAYDPPRITAWKATSGPFPMSGSTTFESVPGGTRVVDGMEAEPGGFFKLAEPLLIMQMRGQMEKDMKKLKELLEAA